eukprot:9241001-Pyramimonas_sp.AAC.1
MTVQYVKVAIFGTMWVCLGLAVAYMRGGLGETRTRGPFWDPAGNAPFRDFVREVHGLTSRAEVRLHPSRPVHYSAA